MIPTITMTACAVLLFIAVAYLYLENRSLRQQVKELEDEYDKESNKRAKLTFEAQSIPIRTAEVYDNYTKRRFVVFVRADDEVFFLRTYPYDLDNQDDIDYKRLHAHEVADMLNEKP